VFVAGQMLQSCEILFAVHLGPVRFDLNSKQVCLCASSMYNDVGAHCRFIPISLDVISVPIISVVFTVDVQLREFVVQITLETGCHCLFMCSAND